MISKNFFEGHSRSKDMLTTIANHIVEATMPLPWTIKSQGRIVSNDTKYNDYMHVCLRKEMPSGEILNLLFLDIKNKSTTPDNYGDIKVHMFYNDGCDVDNDIYINYPKATYLRQEYAVLRYHDVNNTIADTDTNPQFGWFWIWADNDNLIVTLFGNAGATGSAIPDSNAIALSFATATSDNFVSTEAICDLNYNDIFLLKSCMTSYRYDPYPSLGNLWINRYAKTSFKDIVASNTSVSNPDIYKNKFIVTKPKITQCSEISVYSRWNTHPLFTHIFENGSFLFCQPGDKLTTGLMRGDIITIDEQGCDYVYQSLDGSEFFVNFLIKRAESASNMVLQENAGNIDIAVDIPEKCYGVKIIRKTDSMPLDINDGNLIIDENTDGALVVNSNFTTSDMSVTTGVTYYYRAFVYDTNNIISSPVSSATASITI